MKKNSSCSFEAVTELPGNKAHGDQIDAMLTRYNWAATFCEDKDVLEIACGAGIGLGMLAKNAKTVIGGDIDPVVLKYGKEHYKNRSIQVIELNACKMKLADNSVDVAICFEATYYFPSIAEFLTELVRVLRPGGVFLCSSVNCQWHGFNPSPHSLQYHSVPEMRDALKNVEFAAEFYACFEDNPSTVMRRIVVMIRRIAVTLHLVPKTMKGKEFFKKLFYGKLDSLPSEMNEEHGTAHSLKPLDEGLLLENYKFYYFIARKV